MDGQGKRTLGLAGATGVGVGAIVGGGILALAGVAFSAAGPSAIAAFGLNGVVALITALSFAELSSRFPESGGTYTFAKKVLSVEAAFAVGWVVWFASIVAAVLYAIGFAAFAGLAIRPLWAGLAGSSPAWLEGRVALTAIAALATLVYAGLLTRRGGGGGLVINVTKLAVFAVLIAGGLWVLAERPAGTVRDALTPWAPHGTLGVIQAMGFTFIALQGFDLIAAVAGEVRSPSRTIPKAMLLSLGLALVIYLPLLLIIASVGVPAGTTIGEASPRNPETIVAIAAGNFLGQFGYWLVVAAALLSMLSALGANLFAASRVALAMARDRTLPAAWERRTSRGIPINAVLATTAIVVGLLVVLPDVAAAGAASSLIFLVTFALAHAITVLARRRVKMAPDVFRTPFFPLIPVLGGVVCLALAVFQAVAVPAAGRIALAWLGVGGVLFITLFGHRARVRDAASSASDPHLQRLRGHRPLVLVPVANPTHAPAMVEVAKTMATPGVGRVLLLNIVAFEPGAERDVVERRLASAQAVLRESLLAAYTTGATPEALTTTARDVWPEIRRVARTHDCESLLLGFSDLDESTTDLPLERLMSMVTCDTVVLRAPDGWRLPDVRRILVPVAGAGGHDVLRARLVSSLGREAGREITYLSVLRPGDPPERSARTRRVVTRLAMDESHGRAKVAFVESENVTDVVTTQAAEHDLVVLGLQRVGRRRRVFGTLAPRIAQETSSAIIMISRGS